MKSSLRRRGRIRNRSAGVAEWDLSWENIKKENLHNLNILSEFQDLFSFVIQPFFQIIFPRREKKPETIRWTHLIFCFFFDGFAEEIQFDFIFLVNCLLGWIKIPLILPNELYACYNPSERERQRRNGQDADKKAKWFHQFDIVQRLLERRNYGWLSFFYKNITFLKISFLNF